MHIKQIEAGAMEAKIYEHGEALIAVRSARIALTPEELRALYAFLKSHYDEQQRKQESNG